MWFVPSVHDMRCFFVFVVLISISSLCSYFFIMERTSDAKAQRFQMSILIYGSVQSFIGFMGGFYISKLMYCPLPREGGYGFLRSDEDLMEV